MEAFQGRGVELRALEDAWTAPGGRLVLVWGRRRSGKTRLLGHFANGKPGVYYTATEQAPRAELAAFSQAARSMLAPAAGDLLIHGDFPDWGAAFAYLAEKARRRRLLVVLDEFPYLVAGDPSLPSILQRFWDQEGRTTKLRLVLCGSAQAVMVDLQAETAPLFGRVDARLHLRPFRYDEAALFYPELPPEQRAVAYGVLGGIPAYLGRWQARAGHVSNLRRLFGTSASPLVEEGEFVLSSELSEGAGYFRILRAVAAGHRTYGAIKQFAGIEVQRQLERLLGLELLERVTPVTDDPVRTKRVIYRIADNFLSFWFRFVYRHRADITRGLGREIVDRMIVPGLPDYMGEAWEEMCRDFVRRKAITGTFPVPLSRVGRFWTADHATEIDVVGLDGDRVVLAGSVKWNRRVPSSELGRLRRAAEALPNRADHLVFAIFGRDRIDLADTNGVLTYSARHLYDA
jgi:uncharacterized protein